MKCPVCPATELSMTAREGIEIDYCPNCRGVWLDRGELDQISRRDAQAALEPAYRQEHERHVRHRHDDDYRYGDSKRRAQYPRRKKSFLGDLFDFD